MITIGILIFPQVEELDFVGPFEVLSFVNKIAPDSTRVLLVAESLEPIRAANGLRVLPELTLQDCPELDILLTPGGKGRLVAMKNPAIKAFVLQQAKTARYVTSVCTGAFFLAEVGLLTGKRATTYHENFAELAAYSVQVIPSKLVRDGAVITAGGVSSGLELGFCLLKDLFGASVAKAVADKIEYVIDVDSL